MTQKKQLKGKVFENAFHNSCKKQGIFCTRLRDNQLSFTTDEKTPQQPYDFECYLSPTLLCLELKATHLPSLSFEREKGKKSKRMLHYHQIIGLQKAAQYNGVYAGILIDFKTSGNTYYLPIDEFMIFFNSTDKKSINEKDIQELNSIIVDKQLLRTNYEYNITKLFNDLK